MPPARSGAPCARDGRRAVAVAAAAAFSTAGCRQHAQPGSTPSPAARPARQHAQPGSTPSPAARAMPGHLLTAGAAIDDSLAVLPSRRPSRPAVADAAVEFAQRRCCRSCSAEGAVPAVMQPLLQVAAVVSASCRNGCAAGSRLPGLRSALQSWLWAPPVQGAEPPAQAPLTRGSAALGARSACRHDRRRRDRQCASAGGCRVAVAIREYRRLRGTIAVAGHDRRYEGTGPGRCRLEGAFGGPGNRPPQKAARVAQGKERGGPRDRGRPYARVGGATRKS